MLLKHNHLENCVILGRRSIRLFECSLANYQSKHSHWPWCCVQPLWLPQEAIFSFRLAVRSLHHPPSPDKIIQESEPSNKLVIPSFVRDKLACVYCSVVDQNRLCSDPDPGSHVHSDPAPDPNRIRIRPQFIKHYLKSKVKLLWK